MRILGGILAIFFLLPSNAEAQIAFVETGEHSDFTRIVVSKPVSSSWSIKKLEKEFVLMIDEVDDFRIDNFFDKIPRSRIAEVFVDADESTLHLIMNCDCVAATSIWKEKFLVIDMAEGIPLDTEPNQIAPKIVQAIVKAPDGWDEQRAFPPLPENFPVPTNDISNLADVVAKGISLATSQGLLSPSGKTLETSAPIDFEDERRLHNNLRENISTSSSMTNLVARGSRDANGAKCLSAKLFDIESWASEGDFMGEISRKRSSVIGEFDQFDAVELIGLAKVYLHFGLGLEASGILGNLAYSSQEIEILKSLADVVQKKSGKSIIPIDQVSCSSSVSLWAFLSHPVNNLQTQANRNAILRSFNALPNPLKLVVAPPTIEKFLALGDQDAAAQILSKFENGSASKKEALLSSTSIQVGRGDALSAFNKLNELVQSDARVDLDEFLEFVDLAIETKSEISKEAFELADILRFESRSSKFLPQLISAQVRAYQHEGKFDQAIALLDFEKGSFVDDELFNLRSRIVVAALDELSDKAVLSFIFDLGSDDLTSETKLKVASKLIALGFPEFAKTYLKNRVPQSENSEREYLLVNAHIALSEYSDAIVALDGISTLRAKQLGGQADRALRASQTQNSGLKQVNPLSDLAGPLRNGSGSLKLDLTVDEDLNNKSPSLLDPLKARLASSGKVRDAAKDIIAHFR